MLLLPDCPSTGVHQAAVVLLVVQRHWRFVVEMRRFGAAEGVVELRPPETAIATQSK